MIRCTMAITREIADKVAQTFFKYDYDVFNGVYYDAYSTIDLSANDWIRIDLDNKGDITVTLNNVSGISTFLYNVKRCISNDGYLYIANDDTNLYIQIE